MSKKYESAEYQNKVRDFVSREVIYNVSSLISELGNQEALYRDELLPVCSQDNWKDTAIEDFINGTPDQKGKPFTVDDFHSLHGEEYREYCEERDIDPQTTEAYEHWIVTDYLADKLEAKGEMVLRDFLGMTIWGRTCSGQAILLDSVICDIYDELYAKAAECEKHIAATERRKS